MPEKLRQMKGPAPRSLCVQTNPRLGAISHPPLAFLQASLRVTSGSVQEQNELSSEPLGSTTIKLELLTAKNAAKTGQQPTNETNGREGEPAHPLDFCLPFGNMAEPEVARPARRCRPDLPSQRSPSPEAASGVWAVALCTAAHKTGKRILWAVTRKGPVLGLWCAAHTASWLTADLLRAFP